jgi:hypothetical protein
MCGTFSVCVWARPHCRHRRAMLMRHFDFDADTRCNRGKGGGCYSVVPGIHRRLFRVFATALKLAPLKCALVLKRAGQNEPTTTRAECCAKKRARSYERAAQPSTVPPRPYTKRRTHIPTLGRATLSQKEPCKHHFLVAVLRATTGNQSVGRLTDYHSIDYAQRLA